MTEYIHHHTNSKYFIVFDDGELNINYGELAPESNHLAYVRDNIETYDDKQEWIDRLAILNITYEE